MQLRMLLRPLRGFNSIKVRLEPPAFASEVEAVTSFNSIKVRLELLSVTLPDVIREFQFHKGTIRTLGRWLCACDC